MIYIIIAFSIIAFHYFYFLSKVRHGLLLLTNEPKKLSPGDEFISIIIPFRNESDTILTSLKSIEGQHYPKEKFEVIYVNDSSEDDSLDKIINAERSDNVKVISVPAKYYSGAHKKRAIKYALERSRGEIILTTDCDCVHDRDWLRSMVSMYDKHTGFISGPVRFEDDKRFFSKFQILEFAGLILTGAGLIGLKRPVICNAANLSFRKSLYKKVNGHSGNMQLSSGDDEFLMQKIASETDFKIKFNYEKKAVVVTGANKNISQFMQQRKRWASKGLFYNDKILIFQLILIFLFYLSLLVQVILGLIFGQEYFMLFLVLFVLKMFFEFKIIAKGKDILFEKKDLVYFFPSEILQLPYIIYAAVSGALGNYTWKNRKLKR
ncbi:MAG: glycosyltransferase [Bacillota bacterium]